VKRRSFVTLLGGAATWPLAACRAYGSIPSIDRPTTGCHKSSASEAPDPGRYHVGTPGDIISECPGDFIGIRTKCECADTACGPIIEEVKRATAKHPSD